MKSLLMGMLVTSALLLSQAAAADSWNQRRGHNNHGYNNHYRAYDRHSNYGHYSNRHYRRGSSFNYSYGSHSNRHHNNDAGYFLGGLVLGSILTTPRYSPPVERVVYRSAPVVREREVVVVRESALARTPVASGRRLLRDLEGNCFERIIDEDGDEIRVQLEAAECRF